MSRTSKKQDIRAVSPRKRHPAAPKTGARKDALPKGFKEHANAVAGDLATSVFIARVK